MTTGGVYYVYLHVRLSDGRVFYVGKGKGRRHKSKRDRNKWWHHVANKHGYQTVFIASGLNEWCAYTREVIEIARQRSLGSPLVNQTDGGEGSRGFVPHWRKSVHCSNGMTFESLTAASDWLVSVGNPKAKASSVSAVCLGKVKNCYGYAFWFDGDEPREYRNARKDAQSVNAKPIMCSNGMRFDSLAAGAEWAKANVNHKYTTSKICASCRGRTKNHHGLSWSYA